MSNHRRGFYGRLLCGTAAISLMSAGAVRAEDQTTFNIAPQPLSSALNEFATQSKTAVLFTPELTGKTLSPGLTEVADAETALRRMLVGTGLGYRRNGDTFIIMRADDPQGGSAAGEVDTLIVTAQKREEDIQDVPIAISAFTQEDLETRQVAGGPDLITQIPNFSFTKTNFSSYSIQIRGIGTQAISATTDPAVAVAFNNTPFIRNRFFEQEFYDLERLEVLRGPQGTLYGRNATAGVVNIISAKPKFYSEAKLSADVGNYNSTRLEGMINIPLVEDKVALRLAGAWTKRDGYATNEMTGSPIDGRDLWSTRLSLRFEPNDRIRADFIYEHFQEDDDRLRSGKQLCKKDPAPDTVAGITVSKGGGLASDETYLSQGCLRESLYSPESFQTPNGFSLPYNVTTSNLGALFRSTGVDAYARATQSRDLRVIESSVEPDYRAQVDIAELQIAFDLSDTLTLNSETAFGSDFLWSIQDFNRFTTTPNVFNPSSLSGSSAKPGLVDDNGIFCDPQLGCSDRLLLVDLSTEESTQFSQEFRLGSDFDGPFNFSLGANYLRHDAEVKYYVFINTLSMSAGSTEYHSIPYEAGVSDNSQCQGAGGRNSIKTIQNAAMAGETAPYYDPTLLYNIPLAHCIYIDPNPIGALNDQGRNYFLSKNPYKLISYAAFGEIYYNITPDLKLTGGLRFTVDRKTAPQVPSWLLASWTAGEYPTAKTVFQEWQEPTGRLAIDWKPDLGFTDETLLYASYAHGYKAGGANPPPPVKVIYGRDIAAVHEFIPDTFDAEYVDAFEIGTKNTLFDGALTMNLGAFYYDYKNYQVSEIRNRTAVNANYDAEVWGAEIEADWRLTESLRLGFKGGYEKTRIADGEKAIDLMDRTAGKDGWVLVKSFPTVPSNCVIPTYVAAAGGFLEVGNLGPETNHCIMAYTLGLDPVTGEPYDPSITNYVGQPCARSGCAPFGGLLGPTYANYHGFDPSTAPNGGAGFDKELGGHELPNAPNYTATITADYTVPLPNDWLMNLHADLHWQSESWWRVFNDHEYGKLDEYFTMNIAAIFRNEEAGWNVMAYIKNVTDETAITGAFLNSDDTGLTTNVFLTEPRLYGLRVTKNWSGVPWLDGFGARREGPYPLTVEIGGGVSRYGGETDVFDPDWFDIYGSTFPMSAPLSFHDQDLDWGDTRSVKLAYAPGGGWHVSAAYRFGKTNGQTKAAADEFVPGGYFINDIPQLNKYERTYVATVDKHWRGAVQDTEEFSIVDFMVGKEMGIGALGDVGASMLAVGLRQASIRSTSSIVVDGVPEVVSPPEFGITRPDLPLRRAESYTSSLESDREFEGVGPSVAWEASMPLLGDEDSGHVDLDWSVSGGVLFGKQTAESEEARYGRERTSGFAYFPPNPTTVFYDDTIVRSRTEDVTVPNLSLTLGLSYEIDRVKVSTGYSYDRFFDAIDGGYKEAKDYDRTIHGPFVKLSLGFGG